MEIDITWHGPWLRFPQLLVRVEHFSAFPSSLWLAFECGRLRATPGIARNAAEALRSLKTLTWNMYELVLRNLDRQNHQVSLSSETDMLAETHAHTRAGNWGSARWRILSSSRTLGSAVRLTFAYSLCLSFNGTPKRSIEFIEIGYTTVSSTEALASVFHFGQSNRFHSGFVDSFLQTSQKRATTFFREGLWIRHVSRTWCSVRFHVIHLLWAARVSLACPQAIAEVKPVKVSVPSAQRYS